MNGIMPTIVVQGQGAYIIYILQINTCKVLEPFDRAKSIAKWI